MNPREEMMKLAVKVAPVDGLQLGPSQVFPQETVKLIALCPYSGSLALLGDESFRDLEITVDHAYVPQRPLGMIH
jgi:hypothetical protein